MLCNVVQSEPPLIYLAVFYCADNETILNLSTGVARNLTTTQLCNVTIQVVSSFNDISQVLEQALFYNVLPSVQSTSPSSPSNCEYLVYYYCYVTVILGTILPYT